MHQFDVISDQQMGADRLRRVVLCGMEKKLILLLYALCRSCLSKSKLLQCQLHAESPAAAESGCNEFQMSLCTHSMKFLFPVQIIVLVVAPGRKQENTLVVSPSQGL